ncbi:MAG TPA: DUF1573 domain-containing protein [Verrucomicrobiae bacterium]|jgi:hypothetical protein|nr:DUF1573 domain-containing protein [Verrucomicrobiae bacterium]
MKFRVYTALISAVLISTIERLPAQIPAPPSPQTPQAPATTLITPAPGGPMIVFDNKEYNFGRAASGDPVKHTYIVTNTGTATLEISDVHPSCGCTTAGGWTRKIEPGQSGLIPIQFNSSRYSGSVTKTITVSSNAKNEPRATLMLHGTVWKPLEVQPQTAVINVQADSTNIASTTVRILANTDSPVTMSDPTSSSKAFSAELKTVRPGKEYQLVISALPPFSTGNTPGSISVKTSLASTPVLSVTAIASVQQPIQVSPSQITLNPSMNRWTTNRVFIRGNGNASLSLEQPQSSDSRLQLQIVPLGMRSMFNLLVAVPPGFEIAPGERVELSIKSNQPRYPLIRIPVGQLPRPRMVTGPTGMRPNGVPPPPQTSGHP